MSVQLREIFEHVVAGAPAVEPELSDEVDAVFRRADRLGRRRTHLLIGAGGVAAAAIVAAGYLLTTTLLPDDEEQPPPAAAPATASASAVPVPSAIADPVLALIAPLVDGKKMHVYPRPPERGNGWRQYSVVDEDGKSRGTVQVAVYASPADLCFPKLSQKDDNGGDDCADTEWAPKGIEFVRYDDDKDVDWQVHQAIARRISDGRTVAVMATGERGTDNASQGKPALSGAQVQQIATDPRLGDAFGPKEDCRGPSAGACPVFRVPVPTPGGDDKGDDKKGDDKKPDSNGDAAKKSHSGSGDDVVKGLGSRGHSGKRSHSGKGSRKSSQSAKRSNPSKDSKPSKGSNPSKSPDSRKGAESGKNRTPAATPAPSAAKARVRPCGGSGRPCRPGRTG